MILAIVLMLTWQMRLSVILVVVKMMMIMLMVIRIMPMTSTEWLDRLCRRSARYSLPTLMNDAPRDRHTNITDSPCRMLCGAQTLLKA